MNDSICQEMHVHFHQFAAQNFYVSSDPANRRAPLSRGTCSGFRHGLQSSLSRLPITAVADFGLEGSVSHETTPSLNTRLNRSCARDHETTEGTDALWLKAIKWMLDGWSWMLLRHERIGEQASAKRRVP